MARTKSIKSAASGGEKIHHTVDLPGRIYEYFLTPFASAEGKNGGQFNTPSAIVHFLVDMLTSYRGRISDSACGSGGMYVHSEKFVESHGGNLGDISIHGYPRHYAPLQTNSYPFIPDCLEL